MSTTDPTDRPPVRAPGLRALARANGTFTMLAIDQRESLRTLLVAGGHPASDADLSAFKVDVARTLSPVASAMLIDRDYGLDAVRAAGAVAPSCGLIVAVDRLIQQPGGPLEWSELDRPALTEALAEAGAVALKFLVVWRPDDPVEPRGGPRPRLHRRLPAAGPGVGPRGARPGPRRDRRAGRRCRDPGGGPRVRAVRAGPVQDPRPDDGLRRAGRDRRRQRGRDRGHRPAVGRALGGRPGRALPGRGRGRRSGWRLGLPGRTRRVGAGHPDAPIRRPPW